MNFAQYHYFKIAMFYENDLVKIENAGYVSGYFEDLVKQYYKAYLTAEDAFCDREELKKCSWSSCDNMRLRNGDVCPFTREYSWEDL